MRFSTILIIILRNLELAFRDLFGLRFRPYKVLLELTDHCNSKCKTCDIWKSDGEKKNEIKVKEIETFLKEYGSNLLWIALGGGEVTLYKDFENLIFLISRYCPNLKILTFTTNGLLPEKVLAQARFIEKLGYDVFITISLDGDKKTHDSIRGVADNYEKAQRVFSNLKSNNIWSHFGLTVSGFNSEYIETGLQRDIPHIRSFSFEHSGGIYKTNAAVNDEKILYSIKKIRSLYVISQLSEIIEYIYILLAESFFMSHRKRVPVPCEVISSSLHVRPNGDITPCMYLPKIANIKSEGFGTSLNSAEAKALRTRALKADCNKCWMNCYAVHSIMRHPFNALVETVKVRVSV